MKYLSGAVNMELQKGISVGRATPGISESLFLLKHQLAKEIDIQDRNKEEKQGEGCREAEAKEVRLLSLSVMLLRSQH